MNYCGPKASFPHGTYNNAVNPILKELREGFAEIPPIFCQLVLSLTGQ